jgi:predicted permease
VYDVLGRTYPDDDSGRLVALKPLPQSVTGRSKGPLWTLLGAVLVVLTIGSVNVAGLLLARGIKREREMAMLTAIGAGRARIIRQVLTEGLLLAALGAAGGVLLASLLLDGMRDFLIHALPRGVDIHMDWTVLAIAIAIATIASLSASLYPALHLSGIDPNRVLKAGGSAGTGRTQHRLRSGFMVTQVALTLVLLVVAGLLLRTVSRYRHIDLGFNPAHILSVQIGLSKANYQGRDPLAEFYKPLEEQVSRLPGVQASGLISDLPIVDNGANAVTNIAGQTPNPPNQEKFAEVRMVSSGYYDVIGLAFHRGRKLSPGLDRAGNLAPTVVVNDAFIGKFIPASLDPTAQRIMNNAKQERWTQIVGVAGNVRQNLYEKPYAEYDFLMDEVDPRRRAEEFANMFLLVRTDGNPAQVIPAVHSIVHQLDPTVSFQEPRAMTEVVSDILVFERMESWLFGIFASLALLLSLVGLYGLVSHEVEQSTRDIGVRMALGASRSGVLAMVMRRVAWMLGAGTVAGLVLTLIARKLIGVVIYIDAKQDAGGFLLAALLLVIAGLVAALIPAAHAASIEPMQALRSE